jgi:hypothetical protein
MSNPRFGYTNLSARVVSVSHEDPDHTVENLSSYFARDFWQCLDPNPGRVDFDFGAARNRNYIMIENHNLSELGGDYVPKLQAADDAAFTTGVVTVIADLSVVTDDPYFATFSDVSKRYWRLIHDSGIQATAAMKIGNIFVDDLLDFGYPYDFPCNAKNTKFLTSEQESLDGTIRTSQPFIGRFTWLISFSKPGLSNARIARFQTFFSTVRGKLRPFYFIDVDDLIFFVMLDVDVDPVQLFRSNLNLTGPIPMKEVFATREDQDVTQFFILDESFLDGEDILA